jgi:hypothetical protein
MQVDEFEGNSSNDNASSDCGSNNNKAPKLQRLPPPSKGEIRREGDGKSFHNFRKVNSSFIVNTTVKVKFNDVHVVLVFICITIDLTGLVV